jgi:guanylate kinase
VRPLSGVVVGLDKHNSNKMVVLCENGSRLTTKRTKELKLGVSVEIFLEIDTLKVTRIRRLLPDREESEDSSIQPKLTKAKGDISDQDYYDRQFRYSPTNR